MDLCVLGMGYIGLPTACTFATHGLKVVGVDVNQRVVGLLRNGKPHIQEPGLRDLVKDAMRSGNLSISEEPVEADAFLIAVPTPIQADKRADLSYVRSAAESMVGWLRKGNLVVLESTCPPGTTAKVVAPILAQSGLQPGEDFHLVYSPERVLPGRILTELVENSRVVGGIDRASAEAGRDLYQRFVKGEIVLTDATTAELVKLMENTYRDVNVAVANEFARLAEGLGVDVWQAIELANRHPRVQILRPGPGVGGHCISIDPWFLVEADPASAALIKQARETNDGQPAYVVDLIRRAAGGRLDGLRVAALGLAYKADVDDLRESPALAVASGLVASGASVCTYEPMAAEASVPGAEAAASLPDALEGAAAVVLLVDHRAFVELDPEMAAGLMQGRLAFDSRGRWNPESWRAAGFDLHVLGAPAYG